MDILPVAGIDVSKHFNDMCILSPDNAVFRRLRINHDLPGMEHALLILHETEQMFGAKPVAVMESTSHYQCLLWQFLCEADYKAIIINPLQSGALRNINVRKIAIRIFSYREVWMSEKAFGWIGYISMAVAY